MFTYFGLMDILGETTLDTTGRNLRLIFFYITIKLKDRIMMFM